MMSDLQIGMSYFVAITSLLQEIAAFIIGDSFSVDSIVDFIFDFLKV